ncbi:hypothetical protein N1078_18150, partial [Pseudomonas sp. MIL19]|uniref:hypothetical protein n=1 Tax=Pseudomonas sp. MIL19 TaxID=2976979 RepID=UPI002363DBB6
LVDLSTVAGNKISNPPWVKFQSAGWVNFPSAPTRFDLSCQHRGAPICKGLSYEKNDWKITILSSSD